MRSPVEELTMPPPVEEVIPIPTSQTEPELPQEEVIEQIKEHVEVVEEETVVSPEKMRSKRGRSSSNSSSKSSKSGKSKDKKKAERNGSGPDN